MTKITGLSSMATRHILDQLTRAYQAETGTEVAIQAMGGIDAAQKLREGAQTDIVILASGAMAKLEAEGLIVAGSTKGFARSSMAVALRAGTPHPGIGDEAAMRRAVEAADKVAYSTGPSGDHLLTLCERWGIASDKLVKAPPGVPVGSLVADGTAALGFQQLSELVAVPGTEVVGPLPAEIQAETVFAAGIATASQQREAVAELIAYLRNLQSDQVKRDNGMDSPGDSF